MPALIKLSIQADPVPLGSRLEYVVSFLNNHPLKPFDVVLGCQLDNADIRVYYSEEVNLDSSSEFIIQPQGLFFQIKKGGPSLYANSYVFGGAKVYAVETEKRGAKPFLQGHTFQFDILETLFYYLSRFEELDSERKDEFKPHRLPSSEHFLVRNELHQEPVVDRLVVTFFQALGLFPLISDSDFIWTHDIDALQKFSSFYKFCSSTARLIRKKQINRLWSLFRCYYQFLSKNGPDPFNTFDWLFLERRDIRKIVFLMAGGLTRYDNYYLIDSEEAGRVIQLALSRGYQIGLHPSYVCWADPKQFAKEKQQLETIVNLKVIQSRQHFLNFSISHTISLLEELGIAEDHSLGFRDRIGFRCGTGFSFKLYNFEKERESTVTEVPLIIMDGAVLAESRYKGEVPLQLLKAFLEKNREGTQISINFHNSSFDGIEWDIQQMKALFNLVQECFLEISE